MLKDKAGKALDWILKHSAIVFPLVICVAVAVTVAFVLNAGNVGRAQEAENAGTSEASSSTTPVTQQIENVPLVENTDEAVQSLILTFYNAAALGDMDTLLSLCDYMSDEMYFRYQELAKYIEYYPVVELYTKPGFEEGSTIVFVYLKQVFVNHEEELPGWQEFYLCTNEEGNLYIKWSNFSKEQDDYVREINSQDDVIAFNNRINAEYSDLLLEKPEWAEYMDAMGEQLETTVGVQIAKKNAEQEQQASEQQTPETEPEQGGGEAPPENVEPTVQYVITTATVNVRRSDSENADRLGKASQGTRLQLKEARVNGWSMIVFEGEDAFIKSEYLEAEESAAGLSAIGTVTATANVNVRASAGENGQRLGVLAEGETVDLYAKENGWCKIKYQDQVGYVKADYVE
ncbi:MAG: SH3 domain-containing protein [Lachnoclostridium sp.]|nr:SH3 domain-containing protein [Lachnoclostridium sp.]MCM1383692.1 SH3 domain-containing protein [Lachnoclostridium sp.]